MCRNAKIPNLYFAFKFPDSRVVADDCGDLLRNRGKCPIGSEDPAVENCDGQSFTEINDDSLTGVRSRGEWCSCSSMRRISMPASPSLS
jgi:hypothetical protein